MRFHTKKHRVRTFNWDAGVLKILDQWFDSFEEAMNYVNHHVGNCHHHKIYNELEELIHTIECHHHKGGYA